MTRIIKLGGSLLAADALPGCLNAVAQLEGISIVVPGGGGFADQVRHMQQQYGFDDVAAHHMALLAMQQMAILINSLQPKFVLLDSVAKLKATRTTAIWLPQPAELDAAGVAASWDITSDSLAAWLTGQLAADALLIVKSAKITEPYTLFGLQQQQILDGAFKQFADSLTCKIQVLNKDSFALS